jgi:arylsulfatase A-like enzyme
MLLRRTFLQWCALGGASCLPAATGSRPNIVLLLADDLGYGDISSYGCPDIRTPHIDSIGRQGVKFTQCYANAPECTPTRTALLTGRYQQRVGGLECAIGVGNVGRYDEAVWLAERGELGLPPAEVTLPRLLKDMGYETACIGKWHLGYLDKFSPNRHGFDEYFGILGGNADYFTHREAGGDPVLYRNGKPVIRPGYLTDLITGHAVDWLGKRDRNPFFLYVPYTAPHTPVQGPDDAGKKIDEATWNKGDRATYARMVERMDEGVGRILARLRELGLSDNTIVLFLSDNGGYDLSRNGPFRGGKSSVYEGGIRVPCLIRWPGVIPPGSVTEQVALTMDLLPTLVGAAGGKLPTGRKFDGVDLRGVLRGESQVFPRTVFWRYKRGEARRKAVRDGNLKLVWNDGQEELFNLDKDVRESTNVLAQHPRAARDLRLKLAAWEQEVAAPRLSGFRG